MISKISGFFFRLDALIITLNIFVVIWILTFIPINLGFLDPIGKALTDFDIYDIYFSKIRPEAEVDTSIVLVNIGNLSRREIAEQINIINKYQPRVIGLDALFFEKRDPEGDALLQDAFQKSRNMVLVSKLDCYNEASDKYDSLKTSISEFNDVTMSGFANLPDDLTGSYRTIRNFVPFANCAGRREAAFGVKIVELFNKEAYERLKRRNNEYEMINYRGNYDKFYFIDAYQLFEGPADLSFIKNKIVLLGYMGPDINTKTMDDVFFTPLNGKYAGRSFPDMYGIVIHANIISMLLRNDHINHLPLLLSIIFAFVIGYLNAILLLYVKDVMTDWMGGITKIILFLQTVANLFVGLYFFGNFNYRVNLTLAIAVIFLVPTSIDFYKNYLEKIHKKLMKK